MVGNKIKVGGVITKVQKVLIRNKSIMLFITLEDLSGRIEVLVFPKTLEKTGDVWQEEKIVMVDGNLSDKDGNFKIIGEEVKEVNQSEIDIFKRIQATQKSFEENSTKLTIRLPQNSTQETIKKISQLLDKCSIGKTKVFIALDNSKLETPYSIQQTNDLKEALKIIAPGVKIELM